jgi:hypothetical protein
MPRRTFAECIAQWNLLKQGLDANAADLTFLEAECGQFTTLLANVGTLDARQEALKAQLQQVTQQLQTKLGETETLETRLRASLRGKYGLKNEKLEEFGIKPSRRRTVTKPVG